jgi:head-tail adaptor
VSAPDPITAAFRDQLWTAIADTLRPLGVDPYVAGPAVDALAPVIRQIMAAAQAERDAENERLRTENERQLRHLKVWQQGFQDVATGARLRATGDIPAKKLLAEILAVVNQHEGRNAEQAMAEIHDVCAAFLAAPVSGDALPVQTADTVEGGAE